MTVDELIALWQKRDEQYSGRRAEPSDEIVEGIRAWRAQEAREIGASGLAREALLWVPPPRAGR